MKYKIKNKTESFLKYAKVNFAPKQEKILELEEAYECEYFSIEEFGKAEKKTKYGGKK